MYISTFVYDLKKITIDASNLMELITLKNKMKTILTTGEE